MTQDNYKKFLEVMSLLSGYYNQDKPQPVIKLYWDMLKDLSIEEFIRKAIEYMKINKFFPMISDFLEVPDKQDKSILAWQKVLYAFKMAGCWNSVQFDDLVIHSAIEMLGGWRRFNEMTIEERKWAEKDFYKYYNALQNQNEHPKYLVGYSEKELSDSEYFDRIKPPILIGSAPKRKLFPETKIGSQTPKELIEMPKEFKEKLNKI